MWLCSSKLYPNVIATIWAYRARLSVAPLRRPRSATAVPGSARSNDSLRRRPSGCLAPARWLLLAVTGGQVAWPAAGGAMVAARRLARTPASTVFAVSNGDTPRRTVQWPCGRRRCAPTSSGAGWPSGTVSASCALLRRTRPMHALRDRSRLSSLPFGLRPPPRTTAAVSLPTTTFRGLAPLGLPLLSSCPRPRYCRWWLPRRRLVPWPTCGGRLRRSPRGRLAPRPRCCRSPPGGPWGRLFPHPGRGGCLRWTPRSTRIIPRTILPIFLLFRVLKRRLRTPFAPVWWPLRRRPRPPRLWGRTLRTRMFLRRPGRWTPCGRSAMSRAAQPAAIPARFRWLPWWPDRSVAPRLGVAYSLRPALAAGWWLCPGTATRFWFGWCRSPSRPGRPGSPLRRLFAPPRPAADTPLRLLIVVAAAAPCCEPAVAGGRLRLAAT